jgi:large subunit ribosomal protein L23
MNQLRLIPKVSEKAMYLADKGQYVFQVPTSTNKIEIAHAVEAMFKVKVVAVNISITKGKTKRFRQMTGRRTDQKKAVVTLRKGDSIKLFEGAA